MLIISASYDFRSFTNVLLREIVLKSPNSLQAIKKIEDYVDQLILMKNIKLK